MPSEAVRDAGPMLEREREMALATGTLEAARAGRGGVILIEGPAGVGKTRLAEVVRRAAEEEGHELLSARGEEVEREFPYGVIRQLFEPLLRRADPEERASLLAGAAGLAAPVLGLSEVSEGAERAAVGDPLSLAHGLYWVAANVAERRPLHVTVDDAHWADEPSLAFLDYLIRRIDDLSAVVVLTVRRPETGAGPDRPTLLRMASAPAVTVVRPSPLSPEGVEQLVREAIALDADDAFCTACHRASGGNPFLLRELLQEVREKGLAPTEAEAPGIERLAPEAVSRSVLLRLARLSAKAQRLARALAVLAERTELREAAELAELSLADAASAADELAGAGIVARGRPLEFLHPLLRQAVYSEIPEGERGLQHRRAADVLSRADVAATRVASHLLETDAAGDAWVVRTLQAAARQAIQAGAPETAVKYLRRASVEPPSDDVRNDLLVELGLAEARATDAHCTVTLAEALAAGVDADRRVEIALELARDLWYWRGDAEGALAALDSVDRTELDDDQALSLDSLAVEVAIGWVDGLGGLGGSARTSALERLRQLAPRAYPPRPASAMLLGSLARTALEEGRPAEVAAKLALEAIEAGVDYGSSLDVLAWTDSDDAVPIYDALIDEGRRRGSPFMWGVPILWRGVFRYRRGQLRDAEADCRACVDIIRALDVEWITFQNGFLAEVLLEMDPDAADAHLAASPPNPAGGYSEFFLCARGRVRAAQGRWNEAVEDLRAAGELASFHRSPAILPWRSNLALALARTDHLDAAVRLARDEVELATAQGPARARGIALRALGLVVQGDEGLRLLGESADALERSPAVLEWARTLADLGAAIRRSGRPKAAREPLRTALDLAHRCGASALAEQARAELLSAGGRPRRTAVTGVDALTASERRVAQHAAEGLSNKEIAQSLFVSAWTVATHLTHVYEKLGIEGREQLPAALAGTPSQTTT